MRSRVRAQGNGAFYVDGGEDVKGEQAGQARAGAALPPRARARARATVTPRWPVHTASTTTGEASRRPPPKKPIAPPQTKQAPWASECTHATYVL